MGFDAGFCGSICEKVGPEPSDALHFRADAQRVRFQKRSLTCVVERLSSATIHVLAESDDSARRYDRHLLFDNLRVDDLASIQPTGLAEAQRI